MWSINPIPSHRINLTLSKNWVGAVRMLHKKALRARHVLRALGIWTGCAVKGRSYCEQAFSKHCTVRQVLSCPLYKRGNGVLEGLVSCPGEKISVKEFDLETSWDSEALIILCACHLT